MEDTDDVRGSLEGVKKYILSLLAGEPHVEVESKLLNYAVGTIAVLLASSVFGYGYLLKALGGSPIAAISLFLLVVGGSVLIVSSYFHMACYRKNMTCSNGMMVGMTTGMIGGYLTGALLGATNGMFVGSVAGLALGAGLGLALGRHCGIMGAMEGIMAGLMSGIMGAMTSIMLINDNLLAMLYILSGVSIITLGGLSYMMHREAGPAPVAELGVRFDNFFMASLFLSALLLLTMIYGPRGPVTLIR
jgi:fucose 4-O-acetylase-like acetyltransferase